MALYLTYLLRRIFVRKIEIKKKSYISLISVMALLSSLVACDFLSKEPKRVEFLNESFSVLMPASWSLKSGLNDQADLQMGNLFKEAYTIIISESKMDFDDISMKEHSNLTRSMLQSGLKGYQESSPEPLNMGDIHGLRYQLTGSMDGINLVYWHVTLETENHYHQMILWSLKSKFSDNVPDFDSVIHSFEALNG